jgi:hypothetical protein
MKEIKSRDESSKVRRIMPPGMRKKEEGSSQAFPFPINDRCLFEKGLEMTKKALNVSLFSM